jgi:hypothetical protein
MTLLRPATRLALGLAAAFALALPAAAATPYDGDWVGALATPSGVKLRLELHVKSDAKETTVVLDSLDQGATIPSTAVKTENDELSALFLSVGGELKAKVSADGKTLAGSWTQGQTLPISLTRKVAAN